MTENQKKFFRFVFAPFLGHIWLQSFFEKLYIISLKGMHFGRGSTPQTSGEEWVLKRIKPYIFNLAKNNPAVIFDAGANIGQYCSLLLDTYKDEKNKLLIYSFEPSKKEFEELLENTKRFPMVKACNYGLSEKAETKVLYNHLEHSVFGSLYNRNLKHLEMNLDNTQQVKLVTIDEFCETNKIDKIDLLKLDIEGHEFAALKGAQRMINNGKINFIQFEFGGANIDSRTFVQDIYYLLENKYDIYRIVKNGLVKLKKYREIDEVFLTINYLAVSKQILWK